MWGSTAHCLKTRNKTIALTKNKKKPQIPFTSDLLKLANTGGHFLYGLSLPSLHSILSAGQAMFFLQFLPVPPRRLQGGALVLRSITSKLEFPSSQELLRTYPEPQQGSSHSFGQAPLIRKLSSPCSSGPPSSLHTWCGVAPGSSLGCLRAPRGLRLAVLRANRSVLTASAGPGTMAFKAP